MEESEFMRERESPESSSSDSESGSEEEEETTDQVSRGIEDNGGGGDINVEDKSDDEMASIVASAGHQASKFLQDFDSDEAEGDDLKGSKPDVFDVSGNEDNNLSRRKRELSSEEDSARKGSGQETPSKKIRIDSSEGDEEESDGNAPSYQDMMMTQGREREDSQENPDNQDDENKREDLGDNGETPANQDNESRGKQLGNNGESPGNQEKSVPEEGDAVVKLQEEVVDGDKEESDGEEEEGGSEPREEEVDEESDGEEEEEGGAELREEVAEQGTVNEVEGGEEQGSDDEIEDDKRLVEGPSDWDVMMERRKEAMARARRRRRRDGDLTINDDYIMALIQQMKEAAKEDRQLNMARKAATKKIQLLPTIIANLKKSDLQTTFIECGILTSLAEWLTPLPDHSLPHLKIRESILDILMAYPVPDSSILKSSKIGKAVMLLYRHPKEARKNKAKAGKLINEWARPIFGLASDFKSLTRDEREERDYANLSQEARRRISSGERRPSQDDDDTELPQKPGDKGWVGRARVPMPSTKGYVVRPKWNTEQEYHKKSPSKKTLNRYEKHLRKKKQEKMQNRTTHAVAISIEGRRMPL